MQIYLYKVLSCDSIFEYEKPGEKVRLLNFGTYSLTVITRKLSLSVMENFFYHLTIFNKIFSADMYSFIYIIIAMKKEVELKMNF